MGTPITAPLESRGLKPNVDERKSVWVQLHDGKQYLLPVVQRYQKITPRFDETGVVEVNVLAPDDELAGLIGSFLRILATVEANTVTIQNQDAYYAFLRLVRALLLTNYNMTPEQLTALLTVDTRQLKVLFEAMVAHICMTR